MSFADVAKTSASTQTYKKAEFLKLTQGMHLIHILEDRALKVNTHWVNNINIKCLGDSCPICQNNLKLMYEYSKDKDYRNQKSWNPVHQTFLVNVLDLTPVKECPSCHAEIKKVGTAFPTVCPECNVFIANEVEHPCNRVKILSRGVMLFNQLNDFEASILDEKGDPIPLTKYDILISVTGSSKQTPPTLIPNTSKLYTPDVPKENLFDLTDVVPTLTVDEILSFQRGVSLKDIFTARRKTEETPVAEIEQKVNSISDDIQQKISSILGE